MQYLFPGMIMPATRGLNEQSIRPAVREALTALLTYEANRPSGRISWLLHPDDLADIARTMHFDCQVKPWRNFAPSLREAAVGVTNAEWLDVEHAVNLIIRHASRRAGDLRRAAGIAHDSGVLPEQNSEGFPIRTSPEEIALLGGLLSASITA